MLGRLIAADLNVEVDSDSEREAFFYGEAVDLFIKEVRAHDQQTQVEQDEFLRQESQHQQREEEAEAVRRLEYDYETGAALNEFEQSESQVQLRDEFLQGVRENLASSKRGACEEGQDQRRQLR